MEDQSGASRRSGQGSPNFGSCVCVWVFVRVGVCVFFFCARVRKDTGQTGRMRASYRGPNKLARVRKDTGQTGRSDARRGVAEQTGTAGFCVSLDFFLPTSRQSRPPTSYNVCISPCVGRVSDPPPRLPKVTNETLDPSLREGTKREGFYGTEPLPPHVASGNQGEGFYGTEPLPLT